MSTEPKYLEGRSGAGWLRPRRASGLLPRCRGGIPFVVAEQNRELVEDLRRQGLAAVSGNAADPAVLIQAHVARAAMLVIATPDTLLARQMAVTARTLNPAIEIVLRTHNEEESALLRSEQIGQVFFGGRKELAERARACACALCAGGEPNCRWGSHSSEKLGKN